MLKNCDTVQNSKTTREKTFNIIFPAVFFLLLISLGFFACGKKGPPVSPEQLPTCEISDVKTTLMDDKLELSWSVKSEKGFSKPAGFWIYRAKNPASEADCPNCPRIFKKVADISVKEGLLSLKKNPRVYYETLNPGYIYRYKVIAYSRAGIPGKASGIVEVMAK